MTQISDNKRVGRPRSEESRSAVLDTTWKLLETVPLRNLAIEAIARESGVAKTTIYRWWSNKVEIVMEATLEKLMPEIAFPAGVSAIEAITQQMHLLIKAFSGKYGRIVAQIIAEGQACPETLASYRDRFLYPRREAAKQVIQQGIENGEFDPNLDPELAIDLLYGAIYFRLLVGHLPLDPHFATELSQQSITALLPMKKKK
jgi:AcrR family transcriptional regulator